MSSEASDPLNKEEVVEEAMEEGVVEDAENGNEAEDPQEEEDDEEDDEEQYEDNHEKSLILESHIVEGKREKKKVERLSMGAAVEKKEPVLSEGKGKKLYDIERIQFFLKKKKCEELRILHRLLFNRPGAVTMIKKNIGQFNGFPFDKGSDQYKKKEEMLKKLKKVDLKNMCGVLDLEKSGSNVELITRILSFLMEPKSTGKSLPKSKSKAQKGGKERSSSGSARKSKRKKASVILTDESSSEDEKKDKESSDEEKESEEEDEEEEEEEPPKKVAKKEKPKPKSTPKSKKSSKSSNVKKADSSTTKKSPSVSKKEKVVESESESDDSSDDEPLIKKLSKPPTDDEIKETVKKLLAEANLEEVTMKQICKKVNESYPSHDLSSRKKFIKSTVKELIS